MSDSNEDKRKAKERNKVLTGLALTAIIFGYFLYYLISHIPSK